jgi:hypothetical protein
MTVESLPLSQTTAYAIEIAHNRSSGIAACPIAGPDPQFASLVRLHAAIEFVSVYWTATREGAPPILPSPNSYYQNTNRVFLGGERHGVVFPTMVGHIWMAVGRYDYALAGPEGLASKFPLSVTPWEALAGAVPTDFYIPAENFQAGILDSEQIPFQGSLSGQQDPDVPALQMGIPG